VELAGVPGSGKSRLANTLAAGLHERGLPVTQPQRSLYTSVPPALRLSRKATVCLSAGAMAPRHTARLARGLSRSGQGGAAGVASRLVQMLVAETLARRSARRPGVSILDEGLVQALWSVGLRGDVSPVLQLMDGVPPASQADLLVVIRVPAELALDRLSARASRHSRIQLLPEETRVAEMNRGMDLLDELVKWWSSRPGGAREVCLLDQPEETSDQRDQLLDRIYRAVARG
jgi:hypothetical protein